MFAVFIHGVSHGDPLVARQCGMPDVAMPPRRVSTVSESLARLGELASRTIGVDEPVDQPFGVRAARRRRTRCVVAMSSSGLLPMRASSSAPKPVAHRRMIALVHLGVELRAEHATQLPRLRARRRCGPVRWHPAAR